MNTLESAIKNELTDATTHAAAVAELIDGADVYTQAGALLDVAQVNQTLERLRDRLSGGEASEGPARKRRAF